jgi:Flp pilus assembly protein TadD
VDLLATYPGAAASGAIEKALADPEPLVRVTAVARVGTTDPGRLAALLGPLLRDPVRWVRAESAARLAGTPSRRLPESQREAFTAALAEYEAGQRYMSDLPSGPYNLGNLYAALGRNSDAEKQYRRALAVDDQLFLARANLAMLLATSGRGDEAERLLREAHAQQPGHAGIAFNLALLLAERGDRAGAEKLLRAAVRADPRFAPAAFNLAVLVGERDPREAVPLARKAAELRPDDARYAWTLAFYQARTGDLDGARTTLRALLTIHPDHAEARALLADVEGRSRRTPSPSR